MTRTWLQLARVLLLLGMLDELAGVIFVATPDLEHDLGIGHTTAMLALFTVPSLVASLLDPAIYLFAARRPHLRKPMVLAGIGLQGTALLACALSPSPMALTLAMSLMFVASTAGTGLAESVLVDAAGDQQERWMARWAGFGAAGDLLAPLLLTFGAWVGLGWRVAVGLVGLAFLNYALVVSGRAFPVAEVDPGESLSSAIRAALTNRRLLLWLLGASLCSLLDETFVALAALHLEEAFAADQATRGLALAVLTGASLAGLALTERALAGGADPIRLLRISSLYCVAAFCLWWASPALGLSVGALALLGLGIGPLWPLTKAQAFRAMPGQSTMVEAAASLFVALDIALPLLLGWVADTRGLQLALLLLLAQPLGLLAISMRARGHPSAT